MWRDADKVQEAAVDIFERAVARAVAGLIELIDEPEPGIGIIAVKHHSSPSLVAVEQLARDYAKENPDHSYAGETFVENSATAVWFFGNLQCSHLWHKELSLDRHSVRRLGSELRSVFRHEAVSLRLSPPSCRNEENGSDR